MMWPLNSVCVAPLTGSTGEAWASKALADSISVLDKGWRETFTDLNDCVYLFWILRDELLFHMIIFLIHESVCLIYNLPVLPSFPSRFLGLPLQQLFSFFAISFIYFIRSQDFNTSAGGRPSLSPSNCPFYLYLYLWWWELGVGQESYNLANWCHWN